MNKALQLKTLLIAMATSLSFTGLAQTKEQAKIKVKADATKMSQALVDKDYKTFVSTTCSSIFCGMVHCHSPAVSTMPDGSPG